MKKILALLLLLVLPLAAPAQIYKWVDENGDTVFSDQPREKAEKIAPAQPQTFRPGVAPPITEAQPAPREAEAGTVYSELAIAEPANDAAIRENAGNVTISLAIAPPLDTAGGHYVTLTLDGKIVADHVTSTSINLTNLDRGTHTVQAQIRNAAGNAVRTSSASVFHLKRIAAR